MTFLHGQFIVDPIGGFLKWGYPKMDGFYWKITPKMDDWGTPLTLDTNVMNYWCFPWVFPWFSMGFLWFFHRNPWGFFHGFSPDAFPPQ